MIKLHIMLMDKEKKFKGPILVFSADNERVNLELRGTEIVDFVLEHKILNIYEFRIENTNVQS